MAVILLADVQQWLEQSKLPLSSLDADLELTARTSIFGRIGQQYTTTTWVDSTTTPVIVKKIIGAYVAAWIYMRQYSEEYPDGNPYALWLLNMADSMVNAIAGGSLSIAEYPNDPTIEPSFYPNDFTGGTQQYDDSGFPVGFINSAAAKFQIGYRF